MNAWEFFFNKRLGAFVSIDIRFFGKVRAAASHDPTSSTRKVQSDKIGAHACECDCTARACRHLVGKKARGRLHGLRKAEMRSFFLGV